MLKRGARMHAPSTDMLTTCSAVRGGWPASALPRCIVRHAAEAYGVLVQFRGNLMAAGSFEGGGRSQVAAHLHEHAVRFCCMAAKVVTASN